MLRVAFFGLRRSGQHAIINWLLQQCENALFLNDVSGEKFCRVSAQHHSPSALAEHRCALVKGESPFERLFVNYEDELLGDGICILRDPYNMLASRLRCSREIMPPSEAMALWKHHARAYNDQFINFNNWFSDPNYRQDLATRFGLSASEKGLNDVLSWGGGSSFDGLSVPGQQMKVLNRYRAFVSSSEFWSYLDEEIHDLSERIFGFRLQKIFC